MRGVCGAGYRAPLERALPLAFDQAVADADTFFGQELPAVLEWSFGRDEAARVTQPALAVVGENSHAVFRERHDLLVEWLPNVEAFELPKPTHLLQVENPGGMAEALDAFFARHPHDLAPRSEGWRPGEAPRLPLRANALDRLGGGAK